ncbi:MAG: PspF2 [Clostridiaceae bacterium]|nr:PspF2 [Clostridiaceae bacterium]
MINKKSKPSSEEIADIMRYITSLIFNQIPIPINFVDANCNVIVMNQAFLSYLGLTLKDVEGKHLTEIDPMVRLPIVLKTGKAEIAQKHCFKDGRKAICHRIPLFYDNEIIGGVGIILIDDLNYLYNLNRENKA